MSAESPADNPPVLTAYRTHPDEPMPLVPAHRLREWMDRTNSRFAYRCLPLLMANQAGWFLLNTHAVKVTWNGKNGPRSLKIEYLQAAKFRRALSHFGYGILTWVLPYIFRTPPGYNLLVRGPANYPKDGVSALEGLVETDWSTASFTMNWKITRPHEPVIFEQDEPICMIVPQKRGELESFQPVISPLKSDTDIETKYRLWQASRKGFLAELEQPGARPYSHNWQKDYFIGQLPANPAAEHQLRLDIREFVEHSSPVEHHLPDED